MVVTASPDGERFQRMVEAQKMEGVGRLTAGLAHDFNNLMTVILAETDMLSQEASGMEEIRGGLEEISRAAQRAAALARRLLAYSCPHHVGTTPVGINVVVSDTTRMLERLIGEDIRLITRLAPDAGTVSADRGQIEQVLVNLAINGRDAMPRGGLLFIETRRVTIDASDARAEQLEPGAYARLAVRDMGTGMGPDVKRHIFEPYFTTKEPGRGTGLGLTTSYAIVTHAGGHIAVDSELGAGTTFYVFLPLAEPQQ
jgi:two-component system cell cycle sensor histidine kinase/response regulator CckA